MRKEEISLTLAILFVFLLFSTTFVSSEEQNKTLCRSAIDVVFVMDRSGSMDIGNPSRIHFAKIAASNFADKLGSDDKSALVSFSYSSSLDKILSNNHAQTKHKISLLSSNGPTNIGDGIKLANEELLSIRATQNGTKVEILLTDGRANKPYGDGFHNHESPLDVAYAESKAVLAALSGIKIFTIGFGNDVNEKMLKNISNMTGGRYYFSPSGDELEEIFNQIAFDICEPKCGNNIIEEGEKCDDGNNQSGDGCENDCSISMIQCHSEATCDGWNIFFSHPLIEEATIRVYEGGNLVGFGIAPPTNESNSDITESCEQ